MPPSKTPRATVTAPQPDAYTLAQWRTEVFPCSRAKANEFIQSGELESFLVGIKRYVTPEASRKFVKRKAREGRGRASAALRKKRSDAGKLGKQAQMKARERLLAPA